MASEAGDKAVTTQDNTKVHKRASHACLVCRARKVRCDVTVRGPPCMNCRLDGDECEVKWSRRTKRQQGMMSEMDGFTANVFCSLWYNSYAYYQFLVLTNLSSMPPQDYRFLEQQGCLHIPTPTILDGFVRHYFLYVHPILPIIDEGAFWDVYYQRPKSQPCDDKISLLLFQSMLFSCCNFLPQTTLTQLGLGTTRKARAMFYRRAKLLFDLDTECSSMAKSQAALLLASYSFSAYEAPHKHNIPWLSIAIHHARDAEAHKYEKFDVNSEEHAVRKRLWWGCIIRDRILALGMRRAMLLTPEQSTIVGNVPLSRFDLADEATRSLVYDFETKILLGDILGLLVELCIILTDILDLAFPIEDCLKHGRTNAEAGRQIQNCQKALVGWRREATIRLPNKSQTSRICKGEQEGSLVLFANLLWMYYYASQVALGHYEILRTAAITTAASPSDTPENIQKHFELQTAAIGTVGCLEELLASQLIKRLPVTAISCTALPLLLHFLDVEMSSAAADNENPQRLELMKYRLKILKSAMEVYRFQYEGVEWVSDAINQVVKLAQVGAMTDAEPSMLQRSRPGSIGVSGSIEALNFQPRWYLRIAFTIDVAFSKGRLPDDAQFLRSFSGFGVFETKLPRGVQGAPQQFRPKACIAWEKKVEVHMQ
ncbi:fungal specific transcription factor domain-containing protein [Colletotrichum scovillei]|uniref:Fungal specific transcription factor domain-containing protein n=1 Tax=Colletotrichum scovillei TaxID=1209932 RepID=A0A9P7QQH6_9PEZI|nr:fungal specific transcription factor domain-containing protein [Colletotrichum scovillei]